MNCSPTTRLSGDSDRTLSGQRGTSIRGCIMRWGMRMRMRVARRPTRHGAHLIQRNVLGPWGQPSYVRQNTSDQRGCLRCAPCTEWVGPWPQPSRHRHLPFSRWAQRGITGAPFVSGSSSFVCTRARQAPAPIGPPATASSHRSAPLRLSPTCLPHGCRTAEAHTGAGLAEGRRPTCRPACRPTCRPTRRPTCRPPCRPS